MKKESSCCSVPDLNQPSEDDSNSSHLRRSLDNNSCHSNLNYHSMVAAAAKTFMSKRREVHVGKSHDSNFHDVKKRRLAESIRWFASHTPNCVMSALTTHSRRTFSDRGAVNDLRLPYLSRHQCALLFVDISGFTKLSTELDVETLSKSINSYFELIVNEVTSHGGDVLKFAGDALFAEWRAESASNLPQATLRAAVCGAAITDKCSDYKVGTKKKYLLNVHCGVGLGEISGLHVGDKTRREYLILGKPIDQVSQAEGVAKLGELVASFEAVKALEEIKALDRNDCEEREGQCRVIATRSQCHVKPLSTKNKVSRLPLIRESSNQYVLEVISSMTDETLEHFRSLLSLYVHPVIRNDELDIYNSFGLNNHYAIEPPKGSSSRRINNKSKLARSSRQSAEAELRGVYTMFISPRINTLVIDDKLCNTLQQVILVINQILQKYKGHLRQYIVDDKGVVLIATFGLRGSACPNMMSKHAIPATHDIHSKLKNDLNIPNFIGTTYGKAYCGVVGGIARHEFAVLGRSVNLAARLMASKVNPGILVDNSIRKVVETKFRFRALSPVTAKGYSKKVPIFVPLHVHNKTIAMSSSCNDNDVFFVGRESEIESIMEHANEMLYVSMRCNNEGGGPSCKDSPTPAFSVQKSAEGRGRFALIHGNHGLGKTSLAAKIVNLIENLGNIREADVAFYTAGASENVKFVPCALLKNIFMDVLGDYADCIRFECMAEDERDDEAFAKSLFHTKAKKSGSSSMEHAHSTALAARLELRPNIQIEIETLTQDEVMQTLRNNANNLGTCASGEYSILSRIRRLCKLLDYSADVANTIARLLGLSSDASTSPTNIAKMNDVIDFIARAFAHCTLRHDLAVLYIEDIHYMDVFSWRVIEAILNQQDNLLVIGCMNFEIFQGRERCMEVLERLRSVPRRQDGRYMNYHLKPFTLKEMKCYVSQKLRFHEKKSRNGQNHNALSDQFVYEIQHQTDGMPYFASVIMDDYVTYMNDPDKYSQAQGRRNSQQLRTSSAAQYIRAKFDALDVTMRTVIIICALVGRQFQFQDILRVMPIWTQEIYNLPDCTYFQDLNERAKLKYARRLEGTLDAAVEEGILECVSLGRNEWDHHHQQHIQVFGGQEETSSCSASISYTQSNYSQNLQVQDCYDVHTTTTTQTATTATIITPSASSNALSSIVTRSSVTSASLNNSITTDERRSSRLTGNAFVDSQIMKCRCSKPKHLCECAILGLGNGTTSVSVGDASARRSYVASAISQSVSQSINGMSFIGFASLDHTTRDASSLGIHLDNEDDNTTSTTTSTATSREEGLGDPRAAQASEQDEAPMSYLEDRVYQFKSALWRDSILSTLLQERVCKLHCSIARALQAEGFGDDLSNLNDNRASLTLYNHWKAGKANEQAFPLALKIGKRYEEWGFSSQSIEVYECALELIVGDCDEADATDAVNMQSSNLISVMTPNNIDSNSRCNKYDEAIVDNNDILVGGFSKRELLQRNIFDVEHVVRLRIAIAKCLANLGNSHETAKNYQSAYDVMTSIPNANSISDRSIFFTIVSGLCLCLKWGTIIDGNICSFEQQLLTRFVNEARAHGDPIHLARALALQGIFFSRIGRYDDAIASHLLLEDIYNAKTFPQEISKHYGSNRAGQNFGLCAQWYDLKDNVCEMMKRVNFITQNILPNEDQRNVHNMFMILFPAIWVMKRHGLSSRAKFLWNRYLLQNFKDFYGDGGRTWSMRFFDLVLYLLDVVIMEEVDDENENEFNDIDRSYVGNIDNTRDNRNKIKTMTNWVLTNEFAVFTDSGERLINLGRDGRSLVAELCLRLARLVIRTDHDCEERNLTVMSLFEKGLKFANASLIYLNGEEVAQRSVVYALNQTRPILTALEDEKKLFEGLRE